MKLSNGAAFPPVQCLGVDDEDAIQGGDCHRIRCNCTDGHTYAFECAAGTCRCKVDGVQTSTPAATTCPPDAAGMSALCGWNISM